MSDAILPLPLVPRGTSPGPVFSGNRSRRRLRMLPGFGLTMGCTLLYV